MPEKFVVDYRKGGLQNQIKQCNPLAPDPLRIAELRQKSKGLGFSRSQLLEQVENETV